MLSKYNSITCKRSSATTHLAFFESRIYYALLSSFSKMIFLVDSVLELLSILIEIPSLLLLI